MVNRNPLQNITLYNNNIYNCTIGFEIYNTNNIKISNNNIECLTGKGRYIPDAIILKNCNNYSIDSNYINKNGTTKQLICCIYLENCGEPIINYNKFYNSKYAICYHNMKRLLNFTDLNFGFNKLDNLSVRIPICYEDSCE